MAHHHSRRFIGVNADYMNAGKVTGAHIRVPVGYFEAVLAAGGLPVILAPVNKAAEMNALLDRLDGVLLSGGLALDPKKQGLASHPSVQPIAERRDESDRLLVRLALKRRFPILAVGLGMQQLNVACGGSLYLPIPEDLPTALPSVRPFCPGPPPPSVT